MKRISSIDICSQNRMTDKFILLPASYILKFRGDIDDPIALADKIKTSVKTVSSVTLKLDKNEKLLDDSSSKILRCSSKNILRTSYCDKLSKQPVTYECITTSKSPLAKVTHCQYSKTNEGNVTIAMFI